MLSMRQQSILRLVVTSHLESGRPVGSASIAAREDVPWAPSTVRGELAELEAAGFLTHPHTSAGRVPTDSGYRAYADRLLEEAPGRLPAPRTDLDLSRVRREVDDAMRATTEALSRITDLLALVTAPPPSSAHVHRVEVLNLQPRVAMVVVIASNGAVTKRVFTFEEELDPGLVKWASSYLNEELSGLSLGSSQLRSRVAAADLPAVEREFIEQIRGAFEGLEERGEDALYVDGAARLLSEQHAADIPRADSVLRALERRATMLSLLRSALDERSVFVWIGEENPAPELRDVSVVGAPYGLGYRNLGTVGVVGPMRMDYETAIASVRAAAGELSRFFEAVYEG